MRDVSESSITEAVLATIGPDTAPRTRELVTALIRHLHAFAREVELTQDEWHKAIAFLYAAGKKSDEKRNEFILASDVLGLTSLVDILGNRAAGGATDSSVLGPFHVADVPFIDNGGLLPGATDAHATVVTGQVRSAGGEGLPGAVLDVWQTAENGLYDVQDETLADGSFRARLRAGDDGRYRFVTGMPAPYTVPTDGPVGELLDAVGRHPWRPAHIHVIVTAEAHRPLVTELFPRDDPYIDEDAVFGVRDSIAVEVEEVHDEAEAVAHGVSAPFRRIAFDFALRPSA